MFPSNFGIEPSKLKEDSIGVLSLNAPSESINAGNGWN
jgi:hypothetical protein